MKTIIVIPARYGSSRFPGKPLAIVAGRSLLNRVWRLAKEVQNVDDVVVATDDERILQHVAEFGGTAVMTPVECQNGSERAFAAVKLWDGSPDIIVNLQGDAVLMPPWVVQAIVAEMIKDPSVQIATPAVHLTPEQYRAMVEMKQRGIVSGTTVTFDTSHDALYFSKGIIPFVREKKGQSGFPIYQHIGMYAYTADALARYVSLPIGRFEAAEQLEQLRALEHGIKMRVVEVSLQGRTMWSIDNPEDIPRVEEIIRSEGELV